MATQSGYYAILAGFISDGVFPARIRYTSISLSYQLAGSLFGAIPVAAQFLLARAGGIWAAVAFYSVVVLLTLACVLAIARRKRGLAATDPLPAQSTIESGVR